MRPQQGPLAVHQAPHAAVCDVHLLTQVFWGWMVPSALGDQCVTMCYSVSRVGRVLVVSMVLAGLGLTTGGGFGRPHTQLLPACWSL